MAVAAVADAFLGESFDSRPHVLRYGTVGQFDAALLSVVCLDLGNVWCFELLDIQFQGLIRP